MKYELTFFNNEKIQDYTLLFNLSLDHIDKLSDGGVFTFKNNAYEISIELEENNPSFSPFEFFF